MSTRKTVLLVAPLSLVLVAVGCSDEAAAHENTSEAVHDGLVDMVDDTQNFLDLTRSELIAAFEQRQTEFAALERDLDARAESLERAAQEEWAERREQVERLRAELAAGIVDLKTDSETSWKEVRERLVEVTTELRHELEGEALSEQPR